MRLPVLELARAEAARAPVLESDGSAAMLELAAAGLTREATLSYDASRFPLADRLRLALGLGGLDQLHEELADFSADESQHAAVMRSKTALLAPLADLARPQSRAFFQLYDSFIAHVVAPHLCSRLGDVECHYAAVPTVRVQQPSHLRQIRPHCDGIYGLQPGALNIWLPLTAPLAPERTLWLESSPGAADFHPLLPALGEYVRFDGRVRRLLSHPPPDDRRSRARLRLSLACPRSDPPPRRPFPPQRCLHFTTPNLTDRTRVSLDFRAIAGRHFDPTTRLARAGYFSTCRRGDASEQFEKIRSGRVSQLHGLPFTGSPKIEGA